MPDLNEKKSSTLVFFVNGKKVVEPNADPEWTLLQYLRNNLRLCGTKLGCGEGGCGACTVMVSRLDRETGKLHHLAINACLAPVCSLHGLAVTTVEGIGSTKDKLHPVQERLGLSHGSQCGYCTPGIVMSMYTLLRTTPKPSDVKDLEVAFQGNLCRCTGYRPIIEGFRSFLEDWEQNRAATSAPTNGSAGKVCGKGADCCKVKNGNSNGESKGCGYEGVREVTDKLTNQGEFSPYDASQEAIFPPELSLSGDYDKENLVIKGERVTWYRPLNVDDLLTLKSKHPEAKIVVGNTEVGVEVKFKNCLYPVIVQPSHVKELNTIKNVDIGVKIGAAVTLSDLEKHLKNEVQTQSAYKTKIFTAILEMLQWFAGKQIRNVAGIGGNIMTGSPISDLNPIFMAAGCQLEVQSKNGGIRTIKMDEKFFTAYRKNVLKPDEVLIAITVPYTEERQYFIAYKQAKRREDDIAIVNSAFNLMFKQQSDEVENIAMAFGGMAPTTVLACATAEKLRGRKWNEETLQAALDTLTQEMTLDPGAPGGMVKYRRSLALSFFFKFYLAVQQQKGGKIEQRDASATKQFHSEIPAGSQYFELVPPGQALHDLVGRPIPHLSGFKHATGEAIYCDDEPCAVNELHLAMVTSTRAHAKLVRVEASAALGLPGVVAFFSAKDLPPERNAYGPVVKDEEVFVSTKVTAQGQIIGAVVAETQALAQRAAKLVQVEYEDIKPIIVTTEDAIREKSFFEVTENLEMDFGDFTSGLSSSEMTLDGEVKVGGQEQFYLETHSARAVVGEDNDLHIVSATQSPAFIQGLIADMLDVPYNRVTCTVRRIGGGFGGKETRSALVALPVAFAAYKLRRPVRCSLDRDEDMLITGGRNPFLGRYSVGFSKEGVLKALKMELFCNAGYSQDYSSFVTNRAVLSVPNSYRVDHISAKAYVCRTNLPSNTAFRGFGSPQTMLVSEAMIEDVASYLNLDPAEVRRRNLFVEGDKTLFEQTLDNCNVVRCWEECQDKAQYQARKQIVDKFNSENRWKKRGISMVPLAYGVGFTHPFLNQGGCLVHIYLDGSVLISHGGVEMGQGLHTKMAQVASRVLNIPEADIYLTDTKTASVPNTISTAASVSSDLNGMAIVEACTKLLERLAPFKAANPKGAWKDWITAAFFSRVSLSTTGYYKVPEMEFDYTTNKGRAFNYYSYGAACSEVEIDVLTGDHQLLRTDIVMDLGESINPAIDVGQIEGGFLQGVGLYTTEELVYSPQGILLSRGPGAYKIPGFSDAPAKFNVTLLRGSNNPRAVYSSKAIGEPPLLLGASVFCAIRSAVTAARSDAGLSGRFRFDSPATAGRIRLACADHITDKIPEPEPGTFTPWNVSV